MFPRSRDPPCVPRGVSTFTTCGLRRKPFAVAGGANDAAITNADAAASSAEQRSMTALLPEPLLRRVHDDPRVRRPADVALLVERRRAQDHPERRARVVPLGVPGERPVTSDA